MSYLLGLEPEEKRTPLSSTKIQCPSSMATSPSALPKGKGGPHRPVTSFLVISFLPRPIGYLGWILLLTTSWGLSSTNCKRMLLTPMPREGMVGPKRTHPHAAWHPWERLHFTLVCILHSRVPSQRLGTTAVCPQGLPPLRETQCGWYLIIAATLGFYYAR